MKEWRRIFLNRVWLGMLAALLICQTVLYLRAQSSQAGSLAGYSAENNRWEQLLSELPVEDGMLVLEQTALEQEGWDIARMVVMFEQEGYTEPEEAMEEYRASYPAFDKMLDAVRNGTAPELDTAAVRAVQEWQRRLTYLAGYEDQITAVSEQARRITANPLFASSGSFDYRNAVKTEADYSNISGIKLHIVADDVITSYLEDQTGLIFALCVMAVTVVLILEPRRLGLEQVERSASGGRSLLAAWRMGAILIAALTAVLVLQGGTLAAGMIAYRHTLPLSLPVQSMEFFGHWTARTPLGLFLLWHGALRVAGLCLMGLIFWLVLSRIRSLPLGLVLCGGGILLENYWFSAYGVNDAGYALASVNLFHLLSPERMAGRYLNYDLFGYPVHEKVVLTIVLLLAILLCAAVLLLTAHFARGVGRSRRWNQWLQSLGEWLRSKRRPRPLWLFEGRKGLIYSGGLILLCAAILMIWTRNAPVVQQERPEALLNQYVLVYAGDLSQTTLDEISELRGQAEERLAEADGGTNIETLAARCWALETLTQRYESLLARQAAGETGLKLVDEQPLERIYGVSGQTLRLTEACAALLALCLVLPGLFALERKNGMNLSLLSTSKGRDHLWRRKLGLALGVTGSLWLAWTGRELWLLQNVGIRWSNLTASGRSLDFWNGSLGGLPLWGYLELCYLLRLIGLAAACAVMMWISARFPAFLAAGGIGAAVLLLPALLSRLGADWLAAVCWAVALAGNDLALGLDDLIWLLIWLLPGGAALWASRRQWRRYRA